MIVPLISALLLVVPFYVWKTWDDGIRTPKEFLSILGFIAIVGVCLCSYRLKPFKHKWLFLLWGWCFLTTLYSHNIPVYLEGAILQMPSGFFAWKELFYVTIAFLTIYCIASVEPVKSLQFKFNFFEFNEKKLSEHFGVICNIVSLAVVISFIYCVLQALGLDEFFRVYSNQTGWVAPNPLTNGVDVGSFTHRIVSTCGNPSILAIWISMCLPLCLYLRSRWGYVAFLSGISILALTQSAMAIVGAVLGVFVYLFFRHRKLFLILTLTVIIIAEITTVAKPSIFNKFSTFVNPTGRIEVHKEAFRILENKALTGMGLGTFEPLIGNAPSVAQKLNNQNWRELHDEIGQIWFTIGLVGLTLFICFILSCVKRFFSNITYEGITLFSSLIVYLFLSLGHFTMRVAPISFYGVIFTGLFLQVINNDK